MLKDYEYKVLKSVESKSIVIKGVRAIVSPNLIIEIEIDDKKYLGALKTHISKGNKFDRKQQTYVASTLHKYWESKIAKNREVVLPELCISIDIFGEGIVTSSINITEKIKDIEVTCEEIRKMWDTTKIFLEKD